MPCHEFNSMLLNYEEQLNLTWENQKVHSAMDENMSNQDGNTILDYIINNKSN